MSKRLRLRGGGYSSEASLLEEVALLKANVWLTMREETKLRRKMKRATMKLEEARIMLEPVRHELARQKAMLEASLSKLRTTESTLRKQLQTLCQRRPRLKPKSLKSKGHLSKSKSHSTYSSKSKSKCKKKSKSGVQPLLAAPGMASIRSVPLDSSSTARVSDKGAAAVARVGGSHGRSHGHAHSRGQHDHCHHSSECSHSSARRIRERERDLKTGIKIQDSLVKILEKRENLRSEQLSNADATAFVDKLLAEETTSVAVDLEKDMELLDGNPFESSIGEYVDRRAAVENIQRRLVRVCHEREYARRIARAKQRKLDKLLSRRMEREAARCSHCACHKPSHRRRAVADSSDAYRHKSSVVSVEEVSSDDEDADACIPQYTLDEIFAHIDEAIYDSGVIRDQKRYDFDHARVLVGREVVTWMVKGKMVETRLEGAVIGSILERKNVIYHVVSVRGAADTTATSGGWLGADGSRLASLLGVQPSALAASGTVREVIRGAFAGASGGSRQQRDGRRSDDDRHRRSAVQPLTPSITATRRRPRLRPSHRKASSDTDLSMLSSCTKSKMTLAASSTGALSSSVSIDVKPQRRPNWAMALSTSSLSTPPTKVLKKTTTASTSSSTSPMTESLESAKYSISAMPIATATKSVPSFRSVAVVMSASPSPVSTTAYGIAKRDAGPSRYVGNVMTPPPSRLIKSHSHPMEDAMACDFAAATCYEKRKGSLPMSCPMDGRPRIAGGSQSPHGSFSHSPRALERGRKKSWDMSVAMASAISEEKMQKRQIVSTSTSATVLSVVESESSAESGMAVTGTDTERMTWFTAAGTGVRGSAETDTTASSITTVTTKSSLLDSSSVTPLTPVQDLAKGFSPLFGALTDSDHESAKRRVRREQPRGRCQLGDSPVEVALMTSSAVGSASIGSSSIGVSLSSSSITDARHSHSTVSADGKALLGRHSSTSLRVVVDAEKADGIEEIGILTSMSMSRTKSLRLGDTVAADTPVTPLSPEMGGGSYYESSLVSTISSTATGRQSHWASTPFGAVGEVLRNCACVCHVRAICEGTEKLSFKDSGEFYRFRRDDRLIERTTKRGVLRKLCSFHSKVRFFAWDPVRRVLKEYANEADRFEKYAYQLDQSTVVKEFDSKTFEVLLPLQDVTLRLRSDKKREKQAWMRVLKKDLRLDEAALEAAAAEARAASMVAATATATRSSSVAQRRKGFHMASVFESDSLSFSLTPSSRRNSGSRSQRAVSRSRIGSQPSVRRYFSAAMYSPSSSRPQRRSHALSAFERFCELRESGRLKWSKWLQELKTSDAVLKGFRQVMSKLYASGTKPGSKQRNEIETKLEAVFNEESSPVNALFRLFCNGFLHPIEKSAVVKQLSAESEKVEPILDKIIRFCVDDIRSFTSHSDNWLKMFLIPRELRVVGGGVCGNPELGFRLLRIFDKVFKRCIVQQIFSKAVYNTVFALYVYKHSAEDSKLKAMMYRYACCKTADFEISKDLQIDSDEDTHLASRQWYKLYGARLRKAVKAEAKQSMDDCKSELPLAARYGASSRSDGDCFDSFDTSKADGIKVKAKAKRSGTSAGIQQVAVGIGRFRGRRGVGRERGGTLLSEDELDSESADWLSGSRPVAMAIPSPMLRPAGGLATVPLHAPLDWQQVSASLLTDDSQQHSSAVATVGSIDGSETKGVPLSLSTKKHALKLKEPIPEIISSSIMPLIVDKSESEPFEAKGKGIVAEQRIVPQTQPQSTHMPPSRKLPELSLGTADSVELPLSCLALGLKSRSTPSSPILVATEQSSQSQSQSQSRRRRAEAKKRRGGRRREGSRVKLGLMDFLAELKDDEDEYGFPKVKIMPRAFALREDGTDEAPVFQECFDKLWALDTSTAPMQKVDCLVRLSETIVRTIDNVLGERHEAAVRRLAIAEGHAVSGCETHEVHSADDFKEEEVTGVYLDGSEPDYTRLPPEAPSTVDTSSSGAVITSSALRQRSTGSSQLSAADIGTIGMSILDEDEHGDVMSVTTVPLEVDDMDVDSIDTEDITSCGLSAGGGRMHGDTDSTDFMSMQSVVSDEEMAFDLHALDALDAFGGEDEDVSGEGLLSEGRLRVTSVVESIESMTPRTSTITRGPSSSQRAAATGTGTVLKRKEVMIGGDDMLPLFAYCLARCQVADVCAHVAFMDDFINEDDAQMEAGFRLRSLQAAMLSLLDGHLPVNRDKF